MPKSKIKILLLFFGTSLILISPYLLSKVLALNPPSGPVGTSPGIIQVDSNRNLSFGTSTISINTSTPSPSFPFRILGPNTPSFVVQPDGRISIATGTVPAANPPDVNQPVKLFVNGGLMTQTLYVNDIVGGSYTGAIPAGKVTPGVFNYNCPTMPNCPGAYSLPGFIGVNTTTISNLPTALSVYGSGYFSGNIGIGVPSPTQKLEVSGGGYQSVLISSSDTIGAGISLKNTGSNHQYSIFSEGAGVGPGSGNLDIYDNTLGLYRLSIASSSGRVLIGHRSEGFKFVNAKLEVYDTSVSDANYGQIEVSTLDGLTYNNLIIGRTPTYGFIQNHNTEPLILNPIGNYVGINIINPSYALDVNGTFRNAGDVFLSSGGSGRVGIGTSPVGSLGQLTVAGSIQANQDIIVTGPSGASSNGLILSDESGYKKIQSYNSEPLFINPVNPGTNNVGIGGARASATLEIYNTNSPNTLRLSTMMSAGGIGSVDLFVAAGLEGGGTSNGNTLCASKKTGAVCLAAWLQGDIATPCTNTASFLRVLCAARGN